MFMNIDAVVGAGDLALSADVSLEGEYLATQGRKNENVGLHLYQRYCCMKI